MASKKLAGVLWLIAGLSSGGIAFFLDDPLDLAIFVGGGVLAVLLALAMLVRPSPSWVTWSNVLGAAWLLAFGALILTKLSLPLEQLLSVVWIFGFGVAGAVVAYAQRRRAAPA
ncbi:MAG: hypothetical protein ACRDGV_08390 [Candidatus Limnocylindria bacterium]